MASIFSRFFKIGQAKVHSSIDRLEDPIIMSEQGIRDLKQDLQDAMRSLGSVKALAIKLEKDSNDQKRLAEDYERKAMSLLQKSEAGNLDPQEADRLARECLLKREEVMKRATEVTKQAAQQKELAEKLQSRVQEMKSKVSTFENELITLKARAKTANATRKINQQLANLDSRGTVAMLERMKEKVAEQEALSEAYGDMADASTSVDDQIKKALEVGPSSPVIDDSLASLKARLKSGSE
ncbi:MAG: PspA/IM30 family protein [Planctomycetota bacterium]|nr:PspA/IM30 family protein [Planctomycetota bacterium]MDA1139830.1 PspA/IM30 family protein [Planctomycetota bacterium]